ncbi:hypothetical protein SGPA1_41130 [Streptomyces misionensis JCM 4497]
MMDGRRVRIPRAGHHGADRREDLRRNGFSVYAALWPLPRRRPQRGAARWLSAWGSCPRRRVRSVRDSGAVRSEGPG